MTLHNLLLDKPEILSQKIKIRNSRFTLVDRIHLTTKRTTSALTRWKISCIWVWTQTIKITINVIKISRRLAWKKSRISYWPARKAFWAKCYHQPKKSIHRERRYVAKLKQTFRHCSRFFSQTSCIYISIRNWCAAFFFIVRKWVQIYRRVNPHREYNKRSNVRYLWHAGN